MESLLGLVFVIVFLVFMIFFATLGRNLKLGLRDIPVFDRLRLAIGLAVEAGQRLHISLGQGGTHSPVSAAALVGLSVLQRVARIASISDRPPVVTSGEATLSILSQDTLQSAYQAVNAEGQYDPTAGQLTGLTPFSYASGALPVIYDQQVSVNVLTGTFGSEAALLLDASERSGGLSLAGTDNLAGQAVMYATAEEPLIGEELYASGAYLQAGRMHTASLHTQDVMRWVLFIGIVIMAMLKLVGVP